MTSFILSFPDEGQRYLTDEEREELKARAMIALGEFVEKKCKEITVGRGDKLMFTYTLHCGTKEQLEEQRQGQCGANPPDGFSGMPCALKAGHSGSHSSVMRW